MPRTMEPQTETVAPTEELRERINRGLDDALEEADRIGYVSAEESKRRMKALFAQRKRREHAPIPS